MKCHDVNILFHTASTETLNHDINTTINKIYLTNITITANKGFLKLPQNGLTVPTMLQGQQLIQ